VAALPFQPVGISSAAGPVHQGALTASESATFCATNLSTSLVLRIFSFLPNADLVRAQLVCKLWAELGRHPFVWKTRSAGQVEKRQVRAWMRQIAAQGVLKTSGFSRIAAYHEVDCTSQDASGVISFWKNVSQLAQLNETKLYIARAQDGQLLFSRRPFEKENLIE
jgi:F-box-like